MKKREPGEWYVVRGDGSGAIWEVWRQHHDGCASCSISLDERWQAQAVVDAGNARRLKAKRRARRGP